MPAAKAQNSGEVLEDPQIARGMVVEQQHPVLSKIRMPKLPFRFSDCDASHRRFSSLEP